MMYDMLRTALEGLTGGGQRQNGKLGRGQEKCHIFCPLKYYQEITSRMKERLTQHLIDRDLRSYLMEKEHWNPHHFESIDWTNYSAVFKRLSKGRQIAVAKATHNL
jgi:hypothetical protein